MAAAVLPALALGRRGGRSKVAEDVLGQGAGQP
jgi:hypothetical protein